MGRCDELTPPPPGRRTPDAGDSGTPDPAGVESPDVPVIETEGIPVIDAAALLADAGPAARVLWALSGPRDLDANVVRLRPGERVDTHVEPELDVMLVVLHGDGRAGGAASEAAPEAAPEAALPGDDHGVPLRPGVLLWLRHGTPRSLRAGTAGLGYLTVHRRRPGMRIGMRPDAPPPSG
jgi:hypothetical protein